MTQQSPRFDSSTRFREALDFAAHIHTAQTRKSTDIPYIAHLLGVASIAIEYGANEIEAIAALLHGAAEDFGGIEMLDKIRALLHKGSYGSVVSDTFILR